MTPFLSLILPAYNEVKTIRRTLELTQGYLDQQRYVYEVLVAADGTDGTREAAGEIAARDPRVRVLGSPERAGKGRGIRLAVAGATGQIIGFADADYKTPIEELEKILPWFEQGYDVVIGSRALADARIETPAPLHRRLGSRLFALGMHTTIGLWNIHDTQCGFKFFRHEAAHDLFSRQRIDGYMFDVEVLHLAQLAGYKIKEVGICWRDDGDTRLQLVSGNWRNFLDIMRMRFGGRAPRHVPPKQREALPSRKAG